MEVKSSLRVNKAVVKEDKDGATFAELTAVGIAHNMVKLVGKDVAIKATALKGNYLATLRSVNVAMVDHTRVTTLKLNGSPSLDSLVGVEVSVEPGPQAELIPDRFE